MSKYHVKLDASKPDMAEVVTVTLSAKQIKRLKTTLGITNRVSSKTLLQAYLNQNI